MLVKCSVTRLIIDKDYCKKCNLFNEIKLIMSLSGSEKVKRRDFLCFTKDIEDMTTDQIKEYNDWCLTKLGDKFNLK